MIRPATLVAFSLCLLIGCGGSDDVSDPTVEYRLVSTLVRAEALRMEREGGGQIDFVVRRATMSGVFDVHVATAGLRTLNINVTVTAGDLGADALEAVQGVLDGTADIGGVLRVSPQPTGTRLYVFALVDGSQVRIANATLIEALAPVQAAVEAKLPPA